MTLRLTPGQEREAYRREFHALAARNRFLRPFRRVLSALLLAAGAREAAERVRLLNGG